MTYPTFSISLNDDRIKKLSEIWRKLRESEETVSRSEAVGRAIDYFHPIVCTVKGTNEPHKEQERSQ